MIRALVLRTRMLPSAPYPRNALTFQPWRGPRQSRHNSTDQELKTAQNNERVAAMLYGKKENGGEKESSGRPMPEQAAANSSSHHSEVPSHHGAQTSTGSTQSSKSSKKQTKREQAAVSRKRKATASLTDRPARRKRLDLKDEAYIRSNMRIPTPQDYPNAPQTIFKTPKGSIYNAANGLAECRSEINALDTYAFQCVAHYNSAMHNQVVVGEGRTKKAAEDTAWLHMMAKFHEQGILGEIIDKNSGINQFNKQSMSKARQEDQNAILDIYNYAARFDAVPNVTFKVHPRVERGRPMKYVVVTVELPEQGILVKSEARAIDVAETRAAKMFKEEAERYQKIYGSETIVIKDSGALTTDNASKFMEFLKIVRPGVDIQAIATQPRERKILDRVPNHVQITINGVPVGQPVVMLIKKKAEDIAFLAAAIAIKKQEPELYPRFLQALRIGNGQILRPVTPMDMAVDEDCSLSMRETLYAARRAGLPDSIKDGRSEVDLPEIRKGGYRRQLQADESQRREEDLLQSMNHFLQNPKLADLRNKKAELPMNQYRAKVLDLVNNNVYSIIVGATGSGKTTQVPQILLEDAISKGNGASCNIVCTQPRRIAAVSVAKRVAEERAEPLQNSVGYHVRFDSKLPQVGGSVTYCTTGILQQQLQHHPDDVLDNISHLVIDEVHERDMLIDFLLIILKKNIMQRQALGKSNPQVVLMSATMDTDLFASYFKSDIAGQGTFDCPSLSVPGRTFPVKEKYLDEILQELRATNSAVELQAMYGDIDTKDYLDAETTFRNANPTTADQESLDGSRKEISVIDWKRERDSIASEGAADPAIVKENALIPYGLVACTVAHIAKTSQEGAILVFLPGLAEIVKVEEILKSKSIGLDFKDESKFKLCLLHSSLSDGQNKVFDPVPEGCRKIILGTNIAETSITIPDVQYVVDTGKLREKQYDQTRRISQLLCTWVSKSNSKQRAGRAGRVQNGNYFALFTKERYQTLRAIGLPELLRIDLQETCLKVKAQAFQAPIREFLADAIEPPDPKAVDSSIRNLEALDALTEDGEAITPLGRLLSSLPVHPSLGKMIVLGIIFRCLDPMVVLGAASSERSLFLNPLGVRDQAARAKLSFVEGSGSDHIAFLHAFRDLRRARDEKGDYWMKDFASRNFLHIGAFRTIDATARQIEDILVEARLIPRSTQYSREKPEFGDSALNENSHQTPLIKSLALAGFHPNLALNNGGVSFRTVSEKTCLVHPSSIHSPRAKHDGFKAAKNTLYMYGAMARSNDGRTTFLRDTTQVTPLMATLFGGRLRRNEERSNIVELDGWLPFYITSPDRRTVKTLIEFRKGLERVLAIAFQELGKLSSAPNRKFGEGTLDRHETYLADEEVRKMFAAGLVDVLVRDVKVDEKVAKRGWGGERSRMANGRSLSQGSMQGGRGKDKNSATPAFYRDLLKV